MNDNPLQWEIFSVNRERRNEVSESKLPVSVLFLASREVLTQLLREL